MRLIADGPLISSFSLDRVVVVVVVVDIVVMGAIVGILSRFCLLLSLVLASLTVLTTSGKIALITSAMLLLDTPLFIAGCWVVVNKEIVSNGEGVDCVSMYFSL